MEEKQVDEQMRNPADGVNPPDGAAAQGQGAFGDPNVDRDPGAAHNQMELAGDHGARNEAQFREMEQQIDRMDGQQADEARRTRVMQEYKEYTDTLTSLVQGATAMQTGLVITEAGLTMLTTMLSGAARQQLRLAKYLLGNRLSADAVTCFQQADRIITEMVSIAAKYFAFVNVLASFLTASLVGGSGQAITKAILTIAEYGVSTIPVFGKFASSIAKLARSMIDMMGYTPSLTEAMVQRAILTPTAYPAIFRAGLTSIAGFLARNLGIAAGDVAAVSGAQAGAVMGALSALPTPDTTWASSAMQYVAQSFAYGTWMEIGVVALQGMGVVAIANTALLSLLQGARTIRSHVANEAEKNLKGFVHEQYEEVKAAGGADPEPETRYLLEQYEDLLKHLHEEKVNELKLDDMIKHGFGRPEQVASLYTRGNYEPNKPHLRDVSPFSDEGLKELSDAFLVHALSHGRKKPMTVKEFMYATGRMVNPAVAYRGSKTLKMAGAQTVHIGQVNERDTLIGAIRFAHAVHTIRAFLNRHQSLSNGEIFQILTILENEHITRRTLLSALQSFHDAEGMGDAAYYILTDFAILVTFAFHDVKVRFEAFGACREFVLGFVDEHVDKEEAQYLIEPVVEGCKRIVELLKAGAHSVHAHQLVQDNRVRWWTNPTYNLEETPIM